MAKFTPRFTKPEKGNKFYNTISNGGYSTAIVGSPKDPDCNVLHNCVGYAFGRFNEIANNTKMTLLAPRNAENFYDVAIQQGLKISQTPSLGAVMCWQKGATRTSSDGAGHVAVVEKIASPTEILTSESGYNAKNPFWTQVRVKGNGNWGQGSDYKFLGFIANPAVSEEIIDDGCPYQIPVKTLKEGMSGEDVKWLQWHLKNKKMLSDSIDGHFGLYTLGALLCYQFKNGLEVDGYCGPATRESLLFK